jgi:hypothetical protein
MNGPDDLVDLFGILTGLLGVVAIIVVFALLVWKAFR